MKTTASKTKKMTFLLLSSILSAVVAKDVYYDFSLDTVLENDRSPDCMNIKDQRRYMFLANEEFPGPTIEAEEGDMIHVCVTNRDKSSSLSIHYHGIHQRGTPYADGPVGITQCGIAAYQSQEYVFEAYPPGTHYWHAHSSMFLADGLSGPLIVHPKQPEPFDYDEEKIVFLQDWYLETGIQQLVGLTSYPFTWIGNPQTLLINGKGAARDCLEGGRYFGNPAFCLESCGSNMTDLLTTIDFEAGKTYRLRIINSAQLVMHNVAIAGHNMTIVQAEGTNIEPITVSSVDISPGQRFDVLVVADAEPGSYWLETSIRGRNMPGMYGRAIIQYVDAASTDAPLMEDAPEHPAWDDDAFGENQQDSIKSLNVSSHSESSALTADETKIKRYVLVGTQNIYYDENGDAALLKWALNNVSAVRGPGLPLLARSASYAKENGWPSDVPDTVDMTLDPPVVWDYNEVVDLAAGGPGGTLGTVAESIIRLEEGDVFELVLQNARALNGAPEFHPWHSHGYSFYIVGRGNGAFNAETDVSTYNLVNPMFRDTVTLYPLNWVALRFVANNPGAWFFHCHILSHQVMGMGLTLVVQPDKVDEPSRENLPSCPASFFDSVVDDNQDEDGDGDGDGDERDTNLVTDSQQPTTSGSAHVSTHYHAIILGTALVLFGMRN